jgi:hypothetical protein
MTTLAAYTPQSVTEPRALRLGLHDRVAVPNGRIGRVIGFYKRDPETILVSFDDGSSGEFAPVDLRRTEPPPEDPKLNG